MKCEGEAFNKTLAGSSYTLRRKSLSNFISFSFSRSKDNHDINRNVILDLFYTQTNAHWVFIYHHTTLLILQYIYSDVYSSVLDVVMVVLDYGLCDTMCFSRRTPGLSRNPHSGKEYLPWRTLLYSFGKSIKPSPPLFYSQCI